MIISLDMREMNAIKWIGIHMVHVLFFLFYCWYYWISSKDLDNMTACIEAGACGEDIEDRLRAKGLCTGHEPDSYEFR